MNDKAVIFGAIDIGSNAIRLLIEYIEPYTAETEFKKAAYIRVPIRLGEDVFAGGRVGAEKKKLVSEAMQGFAHLLRAYKVDKYRACATSAMREASNGREIIHSVKKSSGIKIEIISGREEAGLIYKAGEFDSFVDADKNYIYMDVGGGSTEIIVYGNHEVVSSQSFRLGTVRIIAGGAHPDEMRRFTGHLADIGRQFTPAAIIGSGGNINKVHKLLKKRVGEPVKTAELQTLYDSLSAMTFTERMEKLRLNSYRADVILPALDLFHTAAVSSGVNDIIVPKVGLVDGIIRKLYEKSKNKGGG